MHPRPKRRKRAAKPRNESKNSTAKNFYTIGARFRALRNVFGETQQTVGDAAGVSRAQIAQYESDKDVPGKDKIERLADHFGVPPDWLLYGRGELPPVLAIDANARRGMQVAAIQEINSDGRFAWGIPAHALGVSPQHAAVFRAPTDLAPVKQGDFLVVDTDDKDLGVRGLWLVRIGERERMLVVRARVSRRGSGEPSIEYICADDVVFDRAHAKSVIGRVIMRLTPVT